MLGCAPIAFAQSAPGQELQDIRISEADGAVSILVMLSRQPTAASVVAETDAIVLEIDGVALAPFSVQPPSGALLHAIEGQPSGDGGVQLVMTGAALEKVEAVVYRNAVLVSGRLAAPPERPFASLLTNAPTTAETALAVAAPIPAAPVPATPEPAVPEPTTPAPAQEKQEAWRAATMLGLSETRCTEASALLAKDAWDMSALGDEALCQLRANNSDAARAHLDQLAAFQPEDVRIALGRSELHAMAGEWSEARTTLETGLLAVASPADQQMLKRALTMLPPGKSSK